MEIIKQKEFDFCSLLRKLELCRDSENFDIHDLLEEIIGEVKVQCPRDKND